ncbi:hypothetical protein Q3G72_024820 [Acer saccharum]|nr:hypothetical protein Q3G72_024820 [Acer saccharum]
MNEDKREKERLEPWFASDGGGRFRKRRCEDIKKDNASLCGVFYHLSYGVGLFVGFEGIDQVGHVSGAYNAYALGAFVKIEGYGLDFHIGTIIPPLLSAMGGDNMIQFNGLRYNLIGHFTFSTTMRMTMSKRTGCSEGMQVT